MPRVTGLRGPDKDLCTTPHSFSRASEEVRLWSTDFHLPLRPGVLTGDLPGVRVGLDVAITHHTGDTSAAAPAFCSDR